MYSVMYHTLDRLHSYMYPVMYHTLDNFIHTFIHTLDSYSYPSDVSHTRQLHSYMYLVMYHTLDNFIHTCTQ